MNRKIVRMLVSVTVPDAMSAAQARLEVRTLIGERTNFFADEGAIKVKGVRALPVNRKNGEHHGKH